ncbi:hypothetical protein ACM9HF_09855 [Colwellia sp. RE-S-Sl-9]
MKSKIISLLAISVLLGACGSDSDNNEGLSPKAIVPSNDNGDTTLYIQFIEEDPIARIDLLENIDLQGKQGFVTNVVCQLDPETGENKVDEEGKEILIPEGGLFMRANFMEIDPSVWENQVKYTVDGPEEIIYTCTYNIDNFALEEVETVGETEGESEAETITEVLPVSVARNVEIKIIAKEHVAESITASHSPQFEVPLSLPFFQFYNLGVLPDNASIKRATYISDNPAVLEVDAETGLAKPISEGTATVTISTLSPEKPVSVTRVVNVVDTTSQAIGAQFLNGANEPITQFSIEEKTSAALNVEVLFQAGVDTSSSNSAVRFISSDENLLTVDENGVITAGVNVGSALIGVITDAQEFVQFLQVEVIGDPSLVKLHNSDFESGVFEEVGDWQTYGQVLGGNPTPQSDAIEINSVNPLDGNYDLKVTGSNILKFRQAGIALRFFDNDEVDANGEPVENPNAPKLIGEFGKDTTYILEYRTTMISSLLNNNGHVRLWYEGIDAQGPKSADDAYFNKGQTSAKVLWGGLGTSVNALKKHEFTISGRKKLYQIVLFANNGSALIENLEWYIDNIRFYKVEEE